VAFGGSNPQINSESNSRIHQGPAESSYSSGLAVPLSISTTNLFEVSDIPLSHDPKTIRAFQKIPLPPSDATKVSTRLHSLPTLTQQLHHPPSLEHDFELVKEIKLQPRIKASPRAAFLKYMPCKNACIRVLHQSNEKLCNGVISSAARSSLVNKILPVRHKSHPLSDPVRQTAIINESVESANRGQKKQLSTIPFLSFVDIRFAFLSYCLCYTLLNKSSFDDD
jgi:hypothetical protein